RVASVDDANRVVVVRHARIIAERQRPAVDDPAVAIEFDAVGRDAGNVDDDRSRRACERTKTGCGELLLHSGTIAFGVPAIVGGVPGAVAADRAARSPESLASWRRGGEGRDVKKKQLRRSAESLHQAGNCYRPGGDRRAREILL